MQWIPHGTDQGEFERHLRTFAAVFPEILVVLGAGGYGNFLLGSETPIELTDEGIRSVLERPGVLEDISSAYDSHRACEECTGPEATVEGWTAAIPELVRLTGDRAHAAAGAGPVITDDRPLPEYFLLRRLLRLGSLTTPRAMDRPAVLEPDPVLCSVAVTTSALDAEPACPGPGETSTTPSPGPRVLRAERRPFDAISRETWDRLAARNPVGDAVLGVGLPSRLVGCVRRRTRTSRPWSSSTRRRPPTRTRWRSPR